MSPETEMEKDRLICLSVEDIRQDYVAPEGVELKR